MSELAVGDILEGRYRIDHPIARGGMSTVYRCIDLRLGRAVAAKVMDARFVDDPVSRDRFRREARAMAMLSHPNLVSVYDFSAEDEDLVFLIMELITGGTLRELLAERGPMPPHAAAEVMRAVLTGLAVAHEQGMVHRDIKPDNILINGDHRVKIADFGLVRATANSTVTSGQIVGTVSYLSPEQVDGGAITPRTDVYAAGIVLFELLTAIIPFRAETDLARALARLSEDVPAPSSLIDGVPTLFDQLVATATMRDPAQRFNDASEFLEALNDVANELQLPAYTVPVPTNAAATRAAAVPTDTATRTQVVQSTDSVTRVDNGWGQSFENKSETKVVSDTPLQPSAAPPQPVPPQPAPAIDVSSDHRKEPPRKAPVSNRSPLRTVLGLLIVAALTAAVAIGAWWFGSGRYGEIPQVINLSRAQATYAIEQAGFQAATELAYHNEIPADKPIGTRPPEGSSLLPGETVTLLISQGRPTVPEVPPGIGIEDYRAIASERTLTLNTGESIYSTEVPAGAIASTDPPAGTAVPIGAEIIVALSCGPKPVAVPDVEGLPLEEAKTALTDAGLTVGQISEAFSSSVSGGSVISVNPSPGTGLRAGERIDLQVSNAIAIPNVSGLDEDAAVAALNKAFGTTPFNVYVRTDRAQTGEDFDLVAATFPSADTLVDPSRTAEVTLLFPGRIHVPNVTGMNVKDATEVLNQAGLRVRGLHWDNEEIVSSQSPAPGSAVERRDRISLQTS